LTHLALGELDLDDAAAARLSGMSAATIDRRLAGERPRLQLKGRSGPDRFNQEVLDFLNRH